MEKKPVLILGAGSLGKAAMDIFQSNQILVYGFLDDDEKLHGVEIGDATVLGSTDQDELLDVIGDRCEAFVSVDEPAYRKTLVEMIKERRKVMPMNAVHQSALVSETSGLGYGNYVGARVIMGAEAVIGNHCILHSGSIIDHECRISDYVQIGAGSIINSKTVIEENAFIGSGVTVVAGITIGKNARIGAGSVVVKNIAEDETVFGNPAVRVS